MTSFKAILAVFCLIASKERKTLYRLREERFLVPKILKIKKVVFFNTKIDNVKRQFRRHPNKKSLFRSQFPKLRILPYRVDREATNDALIEIGLLAKRMSTSEFCREFEK